MFQLLRRVRLFQLLRRVRLFQLLRRLRLFQQLRLFWQLGLRLLRQRRQLVLLAQLGRLLRQLPLQLRLLGRLQQLRLTPKPRPPDGGRYLLRSRHRKAAGPKELPLAPPLVFPLSRAYPAAPRRRF